MNLKGLATMAALKVVAAYSCNINDGDMEMPFTSLSVAETADMEYVKYAEDCETSRDRITHTQNDTKYNDVDYDLHSNVNPIFVTKQLYCVHTILKSTLRCIDSQTKTYLSTSGTEPSRSVPGKVLQWPGGGC